MLWNWKGLFAEHRASLLRYVLGLVHNRDDAHDVIQETFLRLLTSDLPFEVRNPRAYLFTTAHNLAINYLKRESRLAAHATDPLSPQLFAEHIHGSPGEEPSRELESEELRSHLEQALEELPTKCAEAFRLHRTQQLNYAGIGARLAVSESMVEKYIMRATAHCRARIATEVAQYRHPSADADWMLLMDSLTVSSKQISDYRREGLCVLPRLLSESKVSALRAGADACKADASIIWRESRHHGGPTTLRAAYCLWREQPVFRELLFSSALPQLAAHLLGSSASRLLLDQLIVGEPNTELSAWARDLEYIPAHAPELTGLLIVLDCVEDDPLLEWHPGSHRERAAARGGPSALRVKPGDALFYDPRLAHRFAGLRPGGVLRTLTLWFVDPHATWMPRPLSIFDSSEVRTRIPAVRPRQGVRVPGREFPLIRRERPAVYAHA